MSVRDIMRRGKRPPEITATEAKILEDTIDIVAQGLRAQEAFWPRQKATLEALRKKRLMVELDPGENDLCSTDVTELGKKALVQFRRSE